MAMDIFGSNQTGGLSNDLIQQWQMLRGNAKAYKALLEAEDRGSVKVPNKEIEFLSDKLFGADRYVTSTPGGKPPVQTYQSPTVLASQAVPKDGLDQLQMMRNIALAAASRPDSVNVNHEYVFEQIRKAVSGALVPEKTPEKVMVDTPASAAVIDFSSLGAALTENQLFTLAGKKGEEAFNFAAGTTVEEMVSAINEKSSATGVKAEAIVDAEGAVTGMKLLSADTGSGAFVRVDQTLGSALAPAGRSTSAVGKAAGKKEAETVAAGGKRAALAVGLDKGAAAESQSFALTGAKGSASFNFAAGDSAQAMAEAINQKTGQTGIAALVIKDSGGNAVGIGLSTTDGGRDSFIRVEQNVGSLFAKAGGTSTVYGNSGDEADASAPIGSTSQLGRVTWNGQVYSFDDLRIGGKVSLTGDKANPDLALAIIDQAIRDVTGGRAQMTNIDQPEKKPSASDEEIKEYIPMNILNSGNSKDQNVLSWLASFT